MSGPVIYVDTSEVREGRMEDLKEAVARLADVVAREEPRLVSYAAFLDEAEGRMSVVHVHADAASLALHMRVAGPLFSGFTELVRLLTIDVYGAVGAALLNLLDDKAELLGGARVRTHALHAGFVRAPAG
jgi:quinol monooxygenase YgiN